MTDRVLSVSALLFAVTTFAGLLLLLGGVAAGDTTNQEAARWLGESAHRTRMLVGAYLMCAGAIAFILFAAALLTRLRTVEAPALALNIAQFAGVAFVVLTFVAGVGMAATAYAITSDVEAVPVDPGAVRVTTFAFALWAIPAALSAGTFVAAVSAAALERGGLPRWLALIGFLLALVSLFGIVFLPTLGVLVWAILVGLASLARRDRPVLARPDRAAI